jgi:hypothetical protein
MKSAIGEQPNEQQSQNECSYSKSKSASQAANANSRRAENHAKFNLNDNIAIT